MNEVVKVHMASWQAMVQNRNASGLSIKEWCAANNVSESQYYYRLRHYKALQIIQTMFRYEQGYADMTPEERLEQRKRNVPRWLRHSLRT